MPRALYSNRPLCNVAGHIYELIMVNHHIDATFSTLDI